MSLRKWFKLFGMTILIGGAAALVLGVCLQLSDPAFRDIEADGWLYNMFQMLMAGLTFGAFAHMGFFAYLMLNYIARSIFKRPHYWIALQGFVTAFVLVEVAVNMYGTNFPATAVWAVPLLLAAGSCLIAWRKTHETSSGAWIPTLFFLIAVTVLEAVPSFQTGDILSLAFQLVPVFACNVYQVMMLHRILAAPSAKSAAAG